MSGIVSPVDWEVLDQDRSVFDVFGSHMQMRASVMNLHDALVEVVRSVIPSGLFCVALSGGIDSSILSTIAYNMSPDFVHCVTIASGRAHPDMRYAFMLADHLGMRWWGKVLKGQRVSEDVYDDLFAATASTGISTVICGDGADELFGGYQEHYMPGDLMTSPPMWDIDQAREKQFVDSWCCLRSCHLQPLHDYAKKHGVSVVLPYLHPMVREVVGQIPLHHRVSHQGTKLVLRDLAKFLRISEEIRNRRKYGLVDVWKDSSELK